MANQLQLVFSDITAGITNFWKSLTRRLKIIIIVGSIAIVASVVAFNIYLQSAHLPEGYSILYRNVSTEEASTIYKTLKSEGYTVMIDDEYNVLVNTNEVELARFEMASMGLPTSTLSYDTFTTNTGFLTTELERKTYLLYQLQDRIQQTIMMIDGIETATVTLVEGEEDKYAWSTTQTNTTASVGVVLRYNFTLGPDQVKSIKYLVASAVPNLKPENVQVTDLNNLVLLSDEKIEPETDVNDIQLAFQKSYEENLENKIRKLLSPIYGAENVAVAASVTLDFDKMISEETTYSPSGEENTGVIDYLEQYVTSSEENVASGVVGEEDNTDIAIYPTLYDENGNVVEEKNVVDYLVSYITTQVEKNQAKLISASASVIIRSENEMTPELMDALTANVAAAVNLDRSNVIVNSFPINASDVVIVDPAEEGIDTQTLIIVALVALIIIALVAFIIYKRKEAKRKKEEALLAAQEAEKAAILAEKERIEQERLAALAEQEAESNQLKGTIENVRGFAHENPQIAASLIRELLREGER